MKCLTRPTPNRCSAGHVRLIKMLPTKIKEKKMSEAAELAESNEGHCIPLHMQHLQRMGLQRQFQQRKKTNFSANSFRTSQRTAKQLNGQLNAIALMLAWLWVACPLGRSMRVCALNKLIEWPTHKNPLKCQNQQGSTGRAGGNWMRLQATLRITE